jgi:hypothetical protein
MVKGLTNWTQGVWAGRNPGLVRKLHLPVSPG